MNKTYTQQLITERIDRKNEIKPWLQCFIATTPPSFEDCKKFFESKKMKLSKQDYEEACKTMHCKPQYSSS